MATVSKSEKEVPKLPTELLNQLTSFVKTKQDFGELPKIHIEPLLFDRILYGYVSA